MRKGRYVVSLEESFWRFRWLWQARKCFREVKQCKPGEAVVLSKYGRDGSVWIVSERTTPSGRP